ncbi:hypothetical protein CH35J_009698 [Colletotrichum higginsianum]|uniref:Uncharacterized protein n=1 Tax=Colletotrichum higginsianum TaxID=80884 RepID=A0A4T0VNM5_9PEZI|nr:hypothetical protein CH35J_009698 [Colletotrichum higginsianum]
MGGFFHLPAEIRGMIYRDYVAVEGGYVCDTDAFIKGKLKQADGQPICIALILTCKCVAEEMYGLALRVNPITFSTLCGDPDLRYLAQRFDHLVHDVMDHRREYINHVWMRVSKEGYTKLRALHPHFPMLLDRLQNGQRLPLFTMCGPNGEPASAVRQFLEDMMKEAASSNPHRLERRFLSSLHHTLGGLERLALTTASYEASLEPWNIVWPDEMDELSIFAYGFTGLPPMLPRPETGEADRSEWRFSAAATAIHFLKSLPDTVRCHLRKLVLLEDKQAAPFQESHGLGLIPFCKENPLLRIERRVSLWNNAFHESRSSTFLFETPQDQYERLIRLDKNSLDSSLVTASVAPWIMEALALAPAGMPASSFSLLLDGNPLPQLCTSIFQSVVQRDLCWQSAMLEAVKHNGISDDGTMLYFMSGSDKGEFGWKGLPQAMKDIASGNSIVRFNFDIGEPLDPTRLVFEHQNWTWGTWIEKWHERDIMCWETEPPLPSWRDILKENVHNDPVEEIEDDGSQNWYYDYEDEVVELQLLLLG